MRNLLSKGILAATLLAGPVIARADGPATSPTTQGTNLDNLVVRQVEPRDLQARQAALDSARAARDAAAEQLAAMRRHVQEQTGLVEVTADSVRQVIARYQEQREELELDRAGAEGRRQALQEAVAELSKQLQDRARNDPVATTLEKVVDVRRIQLQRLQEAYKQATIARGEVDAAEASLAQAQAEVAAAQQKAAGVAGEPLDAWNHQLLELSVTARERDARLAFINKRLAQFGAALQSVDEMEELRIRLTAAGNAVAAAEQELRDPYGLRVRWQVTPIQAEPVKP